MSLYQFLFWNIFVCFKITISLFVSRLILFLENYEFILEKKVEIYVAFIGKIA